MIMILFFVSIQVTVQYKIDCYFLETKKSSSTVHMVNFVLHYIIRVKKETFLRRNPLYLNLQKDNTLYCHQLITVLTP